MGDAGLILAGPVGREVLSFGTVVFAVFATGSQLLAGQISLGSVGLSVEEVLPAFHLTNLLSSQKTNYV